MKRKRKIRKNRIRNLAKQTFLTNSTFETTMREKFCNVAKVNFLPAVTRNKSLDLSTQPHEEIENFWEMYGKCFPNWDY